MEGGGEGSVVITSIKKHRKQIWHWNRARRTIVVMNVRSVKCILLRLSYHDA